MTAVLFPGQGSQHKGMGADLFSKHPQLTKDCSDILGYSIEDLCLNNPGGRLGSTQYAQPAIFFTNLLASLEFLDGVSPRWALGHSLGEYNALYLAGAFDFETGLQLVKKRGEMMAQVTGGGMAVVLGSKVRAVASFLEEEGFTEIDIANYNTPTQIALSGPSEAIKLCVEACEGRGIKAIELNVSGAFHSRYMKSISEEFGAFLDNHTFQPLQIPVVSNTTAKPYDDQELKIPLAQQIASPVRWIESIEHLLDNGPVTFLEVGAEILTKMVREIESQYVPKKGPAQKGDSQLGPESFREAMRVKYNYVAGSMYRGVASTELVIRMAKSGFLSFFGAAGLGHDEVEAAIQHIQENVGTEPFGVNFLCDYLEPESELEFAKILLRRNVSIIEASAFLSITPGLAFFAVKGLYVDQKTGRIRSRHKIVAKLSHLGVAKQFMEPVSEKILQLLFEQDLISAAEMELAKSFPISEFICVEGDSGGHTNQRSLIALLPSVIKLRDKMVRVHDHQVEFFVGAAGGIGTPDVIATLFHMGADFVLTGSINACTTESGTSTLVKGLMQKMNPSDTDYAPAGDMFEMGSKVQVLKKGVVFPVRAKKLYQLYSFLNDIKDLPDYAKELIEEKYFRKSFSEVYEETCQYFESIGRPEEIERAQVDPKHKMALIFRWYLGMTNTWALSGDPERIIDYQIHIGPSLGAFNEWAVGTPLESWESRHVDEIAKHLMESAKEESRKRILVEL